MPLCKKNFWVFSGRWSWSLWRKVVLEVLGVNSVGLSPSQSNVHLQSSCPALKLIAATWVACFTCKTRDVVIHCLWWTPGLCEITVGVGPTKAHFWPHSTTHTCDFWCCQSWNTSVTENVLFVSFSLQGRPVTHSTPAADLQTSKTSMKPWVSPKLPHRRTSKRHITRSEKHV